MRRDSSGTWRQRVTGTNYHFDYSYTTASLSCTALFRPPLSVYTPPSTPHTHQAHRSGATLDLQVSLGVHITIAQSLSGSENPPRRLRSWNTHTRRKDETRKVLGCYERARGIKHTKRYNAWKGRKRNVNRPCQSLVIVHPSISYSLLIFLRKANPVFRLVIEHVF